MSFISAIVISGGLMMCAYDRYFNNSKILNALQQHQYKEFQKKKKD